MSYLRTLPFGKLKLDRALVQNIDQNSDHPAICRALIVVVRRRAAGAPARAEQTTP